MTIQQLRYAVTISEVGSLNRASEILYVAQPSLTSALQELERELGVTLFSRSGRGVTPSSSATPGRCFSSTTGFWSASAGPGREKSTSAFPPSTIPSP